MSAATAPLATWLDSRRADVEAAFERFLPKPPQWPAILHEAMHYSLLAGGKRLRPVLTLAAAEAVAAATAPSPPSRGFAGDTAASASDTAAEPDARRLALPAACAIEMIHTYSLIHDDLPAMDDDSLRRGRPTSHVQFGEGMAILAGDGLLTEAFALLAREPGATLADGTTDGAMSASVRAAVGYRKLRTLALIADAAGAAGMVGGQAIDLDAARPYPGHRVPETFDADRLRDMHARKTGALIRAAAVAGAIMAGATPEMEAAVSAYATDLGLAFQIVDDVLDVEGSSADLGKTAGKDAASGKPTYPALFGLARSKELARDAIERAHAALASARIGGRLPEIANWVVERSH